MKELIVIPCDHKGTWPGRRCQTCGEFNLRIRKAQEQADMSFLYQENDHFKWDKALSKKGRKNAKKS